MDLDLGFIEKLRIGGKYLAHKYKQHRLATNDYEIVDISCGPVKGLQRKNLHEEFGRYSSFEGIPYAKKPLGELRFRSPQPAEPWTEILDCTNNKPKAMQYNFISKQIEGSEDCLYINVYAKELKFAVRLPVMVWIHGGGFQIGEATRDLYAPDYFMQRDVVLVTFAYRLGIFGFMCMNDPELKIPGNAGLKDQVLALKWVKENIHNFNGDPDNITIFGESAGGASVHTLMLTPQTKGLFHKAIIQSGSALCPWAFTDHHNYCHKYAHHIGYKGDDNDRDVYNFLMKQSSKTLTFKDANLMTKEELMSNLIFYFSPVIEPFKMDDCIVDRPIKEMLATAWSNEIPLIIGANSFEGLLYYTTAKKNQYLIDELSDLVNLLPDDIQKTYANSSQLKEMAARLKQVYFNGDQPNLKQHFLQYMELMGHRLFWHPVLRTLKARAKYAENAPTYCYQFDFDSSFFNYFRILNCGRSQRGVCHADDMAYMFYSFLSPKAATNSREFKCIQRMVAMWYNFALRSNPNCEECKSVNWQAVSKTNEFAKCLNISDELMLMILPANEKLKVWDEFYTDVDLI